MFPDIRNVVVRCFCFHKPKTKTIAYFNQTQRNFSKQQIYENRFVKDFIKKLNTNFIALGEVFAKQCHAVATQRLRRSFQIFATYRRLYGEHTFKRLLDELGSSLLKHCERKRLFFLCGAALFKWENERISNNELDRYILLSCRIVTF